MDPCGKSCFGRDDYHGSCCRLEERDWIIGPIPDADDVLERLRTHFGDAGLEFDEVFIRYPEGRNLFPERSMWQSPGSYPAMRVDSRLADKPCIFYNATVRRCSIYDIRPNTCATYRCEYLTSLEVSEVPVKIGTSRDK